MVPRLNTLHVVQSHIHETKQGSKKSSRVFQILLRGGGGRSKKFRWGVFFYWVVGIWGRVNFTIWTFSRVKTTFCKYWTSIKIKINMTCVYKENELHASWWLFNLGCSESQFIFFLTFGRSFIFVYLCSYIHSLFLKSSFKR